MVLFSAMFKNTLISMRGITMKKIIYVCDKCKKELKRTDVVQYVSQIVDCGDTAKKETLELCKECDNALRALFNTYLSEVSDSVDNATESSEEKPKLFRAPKDDMKPKLLKEGSEPEKEVPRKSGPLTPAETNIMLRMNEEGKTPEEIAAKLGRTTRGICRSLTCAMNKKVKEQLLTEENKLNKETRKESDLGAEGKKFDIQGILALAKAGWTPRQIAGEHHCKVDEITEILSTYRKK